MMIFQVHIVDETGFGAAEGAVLPPLYPLLPGNTVCQLSVDQHHHSLNPDHQETFIYEDFVILVKSQWTYYAQVYISGVHGLDRNLISGGSKSNPLQLNHLALASPRIRPHDQYLGTHRICQGDFKSGTPVEKPGPPVENHDSPPDYQALHILNQSHILL